jgi:hypothetical protein
MKHLGEWYCLVYVEWLLRATYLADLTRVCGADLRVSALMVATQEQRDYNVFRV